MTFLIHLALEVAPGHRWVNFARAEFQCKLRLVWQSIYNHHADKAIKIFNILTSFKSNF